ncbi:uncharacterized protein EMH_0036380 [Eimeria mitis]|uniref:TPR domain-containing protein n=1 Tax=Eimeria mitis TaxID=44415 RepID=U6JT62_9EIME|nr:uncharacterized protein EMH_0036380 [Eimeria mitis]CDJ27956.1 hypothetical protein, conserved [Eimeria mitis]
MTDWPLSSEGHSTRRRAVDLEVWKLRPNAELSTQLKLWGNAAMARGRPAAAASLYTAGTLLLPSSNNANTPSSNSLFAVLSANASLALLRLKRVRRALRTATEAVAADPMYRKAWHRRAAALVHLREGVERYFVPLGSNSSDRSSSSGSKTSHNTNYCTAAARACLQQIDRDIAEAQMMSQGQANASEAATAARRMIVGCCGCGCSAAPRPSPEGSDPLSHSPNIWLRRDVSAQLGTKGWSLVTANDAPSRLENDPCLVLEEEALAVYVHPDLCTAVPKIPFLLPSHYKFATAQSPAQSAEGMKLHADAIVRDAWEQRVEEGAAGKKESEEREGTCLELKDETEGICAGCATVPAREQGAASECHLQEFDTWNSALSHFLYPTLPVVPCGSCTAALFCCHGCRAASSHKRSCRLQQQQQVQQQEVSGMEVCGGRSDNLRGTGGTAAASVADALLQPLALALPDSHRCIARQLLASLLPPTAASNELTEESGSTAFAKTPVQTAVELSNAPNSAGLSMIGEPPWRQLVVRASSVVVDSTRVADWLLNAAWLAGEAATSGRGLLCGARCLICRPAGREEASPSDSAFAAAASAAKGSTRHLDETDARHLCGCCCACCRLWCPKCSVRSLAMQDSGGLSRRGVPFPRCLFSAALHAYGVACCNSFTIRVLCDPEEEAIKAGTAVFLVASLLNHSCAPNAITAFGEPRIQLQHQQQRHPKQLCQHKREGDADSTAAQYANLIPSPRGVGRGALLQVRLCAPHNRGGSDRLQELCISYGPVVGLPKSSWGFRQDWLLKHAGFFCRCEVGVHFLPSDPVSPCSFLQQRGSKRAF